MNSVEHRRKKKITSILSVTYHPSTSLKMLQGWLSRECKNKMCTKKDYERNMISNIIKTKKKRKELRE